MIDLGLTAEFQTKLDALIAACKARRVIMQPYFGLRDPVTQAKLWRQSRAPGAIRDAKRMLIQSNAPFLARCIDAAGIARGTWATNALPGLSFHQYGTACDCAWVVDGEETWDVNTFGANNGYRIYAEEAKKLGLRTLGSIGDWGHVQESQLSAPDYSPGGYTLAQIDAIMAAKFAGVIK